jgi:beta-glucanase (GH16 family)
MLFATLAPGLAWSQADGLSLVWADEFDTPGLPDPTKWTYDVGGHGWGNNELQFYTDGRLENARVEDGRLIIEAIREPWGRSHQYTSARLVSTGEGSWLYGRFEIRAKLPSGRGTWPAAWMLPTDWAYGGWPDSGEIDIMEHVGYDMHRVHGTVHTESFNHTLGTQVGNSIVVPTASEQFHVYVLEWRPNRIDIFVDETLYFTFANDGTGPASWPFDRRFHLLLNIAVGGNWGGARGVDESIWPQRMEVDYVRVYAFDDLDAGLVHPVPGRIEAEAFQRHFGTRVETTTDTGGGLNLGYLSEGDWVEYALEVSQAGRYALAVRYASPGGTAGLTVTAPDATPVTTLLTTATGGWQNWATASLGEIHLPAGRSILRVDLEVPGAEDLNLNWFELSLVEADPWGGFPLLGPLHVDTGNYLGILYVGEAPWFYAYQIAKWIYLPNGLTPDGGWAFIHR